MKNKKFNSGKNQSRSKNSNKKSKVFISLKKEIKTNPIYSKDFRRLYSYFKQRRRIEWLTRYNFQLRVFISLVLSICLACTYFFKTEFENLINSMPSIEYENGVYVHFIDVGQGKAIAIRTGDGKNFLIDCGHKNEYQKFFGYLEQYFFTKDSSSEEVFASMNLKDVNLKIKTETDNLFSINNYQSLSSIQNSLVVHSYSLLSNNNHSLLSIHNQNLISIGSHALINNLTLNKNILKTTTLNESCNNLIFDDAMYEKANYTYQNFNENVFDYFILTHPDSDHIGNSEQLFENYEIKNCYRPYIFTPDEANLLGIDNPKQIDNSSLFNDFVKALDAENCGIMFNFSGEKIEGENYIFEFLTPLEQAYNASNSYSPIIIFTYFYENASLNSSDFTDKPSIKFMFTGDATSTSELEALSISNENENLLKVDVLDVAHHGSNSSSIENFLNEVGAEFAVISVGKNNYNLPSQHVIERLVASGTNFQKILRTDELGTIIFHVSENGNLEFFNQSKINLNHSNYSYLDIYINFQLAIIIVCFFINLPPKRELF